jgi:ectoine hydroxylase-related dioxygenase (phytanoyl-CoA dioxygenase family)
MLSIEEQQQYREEAYLIFPGLISGESLQRYKGLMDDLVGRARAMKTNEGSLALQPDEQGDLIPGRLFKVQGVCVEEPGLLDLAREPAIVSRVTDIIGSSLHMFGSKFFPMLPQGGTSTGWHQDNHYFGTRSHQVVSCGIYLENTDRSNACLRVLPRSHATGELVAHEGGKGTFAHGNWTEVDESQATFVECPAGTVVLFSANLLHGAATNTSDRSRYSTAWHYIPADLDLEQFPFGTYKDRHVIV